MKKYGLIGYPLSHSFSPSYFKEKFDKNNEDAEYLLYPLETIQEIEDLLKNKDLEGLNVTIPYKEQVLPFIDHLSSDVQSLGALNTIKIIDGVTYGFNSDVYGFQISLQSFLMEEQEKIEQALILGTGGASKAVGFVLDAMNISFQYVSRSNPDCLSYEDLKNQLNNYRLIINTTPLGMSPNVDHCPDLPYDELSSNHFLFDLIYNPEKTLFLKRGEDKGAAIKNGFDMLVLQAEKSWEIWTHDQINNNQTI